MLSIAEHLTEWEPSTIYFKTLRDGLWLVLLGKQATKNLPPLVAIHLGTDLCSMLSLTVLSLPRWQEESTGIVQAYGPSVIYA